MDELTNTPNITAPGFDINTLDVDSLPAEFLNKIEKARREKGKERIVNTRVSLLEDEQLFLDGEADVIDNYGKTVVAVARKREKEGATLAELATVMQPEFLRKAVENLKTNGIIKVVKLYPDGTDSGNKKHLYLPEFAPTPKQRS
jgi:hypothetical protein